MGYSTEFSGHFTLNKKLDSKLHQYLIKFNETRRMKRTLPEQYGTDGEFYVDGGGHAGQDDEDNIIDYNKPPKTQPGLWCQWRPTEDGMGIEWDGGEKFYEYNEWLVYIIQNFLAPAGYVLNGDVSWQGEDSDDFGIMLVTDNVLSIGISQRTLDLSKIYNPIYSRDQVMFVLDTVFEQHILRDVTPEIKLLGPSNE